MTTTTGTPTPARRKASFGLAATLLGAPVAVAFINPGLATILFTAELVVVLVILTTAVFSPTTISERAFRLLRWMTGNPEPHHPLPSQEGASLQQRAFSRPTMRQGE